MAKKLKLRITKCYLVEVVDEQGYVQYYEQDGMDYVADDYVFGSKEEAKKRGETLTQWVRESEESNGKI